MLICEVTQQSDVNAVWTAIASPIQQLYRDLEDLAERLHDQGKIKNIGFVAGSAKQRWVEKFVKGETRERGLSKQPSMMPHLRALAEQHPQHSQLLRRLLKTWNGKFSQLEDNLPDALIELGDGIGSTSLINHANAWKKKAREFYKKVNDLKHSEEDEESTPKKRTDKELQRQQQQQAEQMLNVVLAQLPKNQRHDIRQAVIRKDNPLQALKAELAKRNISL